MALSYGFFNAELTQSGQYDRVYAAEQFAEYFHLIVSNGVFPDPATQLQVVASNTPDMNVNVSDGYGWINGYFAKNSGSYPLAIQAASGTLNRVDAVVLRWVNASRSMELAVKTGIAASSPAIPALQRDTDVYEIMLATVTVAAGATSITQSSITDKRADTSVCGWVTGAVQNIDTTNLFAQYDAAFSEWFKDVQSQLEGDVATNLLNRINSVDLAKVNISDKASDEDIKNGNDSKWVSAKQLKSQSDIHYVPIYFMLIASVNDDSVASALGKNNSDIKQIGMALYKYERFKNTGIQQLNALMSIDTVDELFSSRDALSDLYIATNAFDLLKANSYTSGRFDKIPESVICQACAKLAGDPEYLSVTTAEALASSMLQYKSAYVAPINKYSSAISQIQDRINESFFSKADKLELFSDQSLVDMVLDIDFLSKYVDDNSSTYAGYAGASGLLKTGSGGVSSRAINYTACNVKCFALYGSVPGGYSSSSQYIGHGIYKGTLASASAQSSASFSGLAVCDYFRLSTSYTDSGSASAKWIQHS